MASCKITVIKKYYDQELVQEYCANTKTGECKKFEVGQIFFITKGDYFNMMKGHDFCSEAFACIQHYIYAALQGGSIMEGWMKDEHVMIACCNDGVRPVVFKIERIDN